MPMGCATDAQLIDNLYSLNQFDTLRVLWLQPLVQGHIWHLLMIAAISGDHTDLLFGMLMVALHDHISNYQSRL